MKQSGWQQKIAAVWAKPRARSIAGGAACALLLAVATATLLYYVFGPSLASFHADCTDSLLWAQATLETGKPLAEDFHYAALLPFGSSVWMVPVLSVFGFTMTAQQVSMAIFAVLFVAAAFALFRALRFQPALAGGAAFVLCMLLSGSPKLREIMWEHTIYYSLGLLLLMVLVTLSVHLLRALEDGGKSGTVRLFIYTALLWGLCVGCGVDGFQMAVITVAPLAGAIVMQVLTDGGTPLRSGKAMRSGLVACIAALGIGCGLMLMWVITKKGTIVAGYENAFSGWAAFSAWKDNAQLFLPHFLSLFGVDVAAGERLFSVLSIKLMIRLVAAWCVLLLPFLLFTKYKTVKSRATRLMLWTHTLLAAVLLFGFICGYLASANWRLTPLVGTGIITALLYLRELFGGSTVEKRMAALLAAVLVASAALNAHAMLSMPRDAGRNQAPIEIAQTLAEKGLDYGYATFWNAQSTALLSDRAVQVIPVTVDDAGVRVYRYQIRDAWVDKTSNRSAYFVVLSVGEYQTAQTNGFYKEHAPHLLEEYQQHGYYVLIYNQNPVLY